MSENLNGGEVLSEPEQRFVDFVDAHCYADDLGTNEVSYRIGSFDLFAPGQFVAVDQAVFSTFYDVDDEGYVTPNAPRIYEIALLRDAEEVCVLVRYPDAGFAINFIGGDNEYMFDGDQRIASLVTNLAEHEILGLMVPTPVPSVDIPPDES